MKIEFRLNFRDYQEAMKMNLRQHKIVYFSLWNFSIVFMLFAIGRFFFGDIIGGILVLLFAIIINPQGNLLQNFFLKRSWNNQNNTLR